MPDLAYIQLGVPNARGTSFSFYIALEAPMAAPTQDRKIKCPHCGWIRTVPAQMIADEASADVAKGIGDTLKNVATRIRAALADPQLDAANAWLDMPPCPNCRKPYRYNLRSGEVTP